jgi:hypothetical protein
LLLWYQVKISTLEDFLSIFNPFSLGQVQVLSSQQTASGHFGFASKTQQLLVGCNVGGGVVRSILGATVVGFGFGGIVVGIGVGGRVDGCNVGGREVCCRVVGIGVGAQVDSSGVGGMVVGIGVSCGVGEKEVQGTS